MKPISMFSASLIILFTGTSVKAQETGHTRPFLIHTMYLSSTDENKNINTDSVLKIFKKNILEPNQFYTSSKIVSHWYGQDSRQVLVITEYNNWDDIAKSEIRQNEIIEQMMKDKSMAAIGKMWESLIFPEHHSDEIYRVVAE
ncbi:MAG TPA: hypothetical protein VII28_16135 [Puia sp.]